MRVIALNKFEYANKTRLPGEEFETTSDKDAEILQIAQQVKIQNAPAAKVETRVLKAEEKQEQIASDPKKKYYRRRDLRAEE